MRLKYYLRGAGVGMVVTTVILMIVFRGYLATLETTNTTQQMNGETVAQAQTEQMDTENATENMSSEIIETESNDTESKNTESQDTETEKTETETTEPENTENSSGQNETEVAAEPAPQAEPAEAEESQAQTVVLEVRPGDSSDAVAAKMQNLGLVENAAEFNRYLIDAGIDERLRVGSYEMNIGDTFETLAGILGA